MNLICTLLTNAFILGIVLLFLTLLTVRSTGRSFLYHFSSYLARCLSKAVLILPGLASGLECSIEGFKVGFLREFPQRLKSISHKEDIAA
jgi:hypothetical protein